MCPKPSHSDIFDIEVLSRTLDVGRSNALNSLYGRKTSRLLLLPNAWQPSFAAITTMAFHEWKRLSKEQKLTAINKLAIKILRWSHNINGSEYKDLIIRSSAENETLSERGKFKSIVVRSGFTKRTLSKAIDEIYTHFLTISREGDLGLIIQSYVNPLVRGHLSNEVRLSPTLNQWTLHIEHPRPIIEKGLNSKFIKPPGIDVPIICRSVHDIKRSLRKLGNWINTRIEGRTHIEWCVSNGKMWIVQLDLEDDQPDTGVDPDVVLSSLIGQGSIERFHGKPVFQEYKPGSRTRWSKLKNLNDFYVDADTQLPHLFYASAEKVATALADKATRKSLRDEIQSRTSGRAVIRTDSQDRTLGQFNLPKTETVDGDKAVKWLGTNISGFRSRKIALKDICFVLHQYIPAKSAAWSYNKYGDPVVEIDGLWGLPDGLQFLPHDSFEVDTRRRIILSERTRYKPRFLQEQEDGSWTYVDVGRAYGRHRSLSEKTLFEIAERTRAISDNISEDAQIMWFCELSPDGGLGKNLPWYRAPQPVARMFPRKRSLARVRISTQEDIRKLKKRKGQKVILEIEPDAPLIRSDRFLDSIIKIAKSKDYPIELAGSFLGHAYYRLSSAGITVYSSDAPSFTRVRGRKVFRKIVRDEIPSAIAAQGEMVTEAVLDPSEAVPALTAKLIEETVELSRAASKTEYTEELGDLYEVLLAICRNIEIDWSAVVRAARKKRKKRGGFEGGRVLISTSLPQPDKSGAQSAEERIISLEQMGQIEVGDGVANIPFARIFSSDDPPSVTIPYQNFKVKIRLSFDNGSLQLVVEVDEDADNVPEQLRFDVE